MGAKNPLPGIPGGAVYVCVEVLRDNHARILSTKTVPTLRKIYEKRGVSGVLRPGEVLPERAIDGARRRRLGRGEDGEDLLRV